MTEQRASPDDPSQPRLGIQGPVVAWQDPWAGVESDRIMRTGTGVTIVSQDAAPTAAGFLALLKELKADFYVHHVMPDLAGHGEMLRDTAEAGLGVVLGNEYGNINGPHQAGTNRYDVPREAIIESALAGHLEGVLYDEPEHLQINADQYLKDAFLPHFAQTDGATAEQAAVMIEATVSGLVDEITASAASLGEERALPVLSEQVFPVLFHTLARAGMTPCPKVMKESFQPLQLSTALGAAIQYRRDFWICADLWGPDIGPWFTRAPGFPGHSPLEYASALRMAYLFGPSHLFAEAVDVLATHSGDDRFALSEFGEVWREFATDFVPANPLRWTYADARADTVLIHAEDSDFGRHTLPFGNREGNAPRTAESIFDAWHLLSHGAIPAHGSCLHIDGYDFPRHRLNSIPRSTYPLAAGADVATTMHPLFQPVDNVLVFDETVTDHQLGEPGLIMVVGSRLPEKTLAMLRTRAMRGATVVIAQWLTSDETRSTERLGAGRWIVSDDLLHDAEVREAIDPHLGPPDRWTQRFEDIEVRIQPVGGSGVELGFEIVDAPRGRARPRTARTMLSA